MDERDGMTKLYREATAAESKQDGVIVALYGGVIEVVATPIPWCAEDNSAMLGNDGDGHRICREAFLTSAKLGDCRLEEPQRVYRIKP